MVIRCGRRDTAGGPYEAASGAYRGAASQGRPGLADADLGAAIRRWFAGRSVGGHRAAPLLRTGPRRRRPDRRQPLR